MALDTMPSVRAGGALLELAYIDPMSLWPPTVRVAKRVARLPIDYCVVVGIVLACMLATWWARRALGDDPTRDR
jgi:hypothetical protein